MIADDELVAPAPGTDAVKKFDLDFGVLRQGPRDGSPCDSCAGDDNFHISFR